METLTFHTQEIPFLDEAGARFVVVAYNSTWRDGEATSSRHMIPKIKRELQKRFMKRFLTQ